LSFAKTPFIVRVDPKHSMQEPRFYALGRTDQKRLLFVAFTMRRTLIRIISAREMTARSGQPMKSMKTKKNLKVLPTFSSENRVLSATLLNSTFLKC
jgi:hypothetical protein